MKMISSNRVIKFIFLAVVLILMLALCGCRTRVTNNSEVTNVMYDEDGMLSEEYDMRREELELSIAKKPIITGWGTAPEDESQYYDDDDADVLEEYDADAFEGPDDDDDEEKPKASTATGRRTTSTSRPTTRPSGSGGTTVSRVKITLDANGGKSNINVTYRTANGQYGALPTPTREGYKFKGWYTKKEGGTKITSTTKIKGNQGVTLYAQWEKDKKTKPKKEEKTDPEPSKPEEPEKPEEPQEEEVYYTVIYTDGEGGKVFGDKSFANLKKSDNTPKYNEDDKPPFREGYSFLGWSPEPTSTIDVSNADSNHRITYTAQWKDNYAAWSSYFKDQTDNLDTVDCVVDGDDIDELVSSCNGNSGGESPKIAIVETKKSLKDLTEEDADAARGSCDKVIFISKNAAKDEDPYKSLYLRLLLLSYMHDGVDIGTAMEDLGIGENEEFISVF